MSEGPKNKGGETGGSNGSGSQWDTDFPPFGGRTPVEQRTKEENPSEGAGAEDTTEDDRAYREWLEKAGQRGDDYDPGVNFEGESARAGTSSHFDYHPRQKGESNQQYSDRSAWERLVREKSAEFPRLEKPDGSKETNKEWYARVNIPSLEDYMNGVRPVEESTPADDENKSMWAKMTVEERKQFVKDHPRLPGESTAEWGARVGVGGGAGAGEADPLDSAAAGGGEENDDSEEGEEEDNDAERERSHEELLKVFEGTGARRWLREINMTSGDLMSLTDEELEELVAEYEAYKERRNEIQHALMNREVAIWLQTVKGLTSGDLARLTNDELQALLDEYYGNSEEEEEEEEEEEGEEGDDGEDDPDGKHKKPLVAARLNREKDAREAARLIAENMLTDKLKDAGLIKRFIMGGVMRDGFRLKYERAALKSIRAKQEGGTGEYNLDDKDWAVKSGLERFVQAYIRGLEEEMVHGKAGEKFESFTIDADGNVVYNKLGEDGKKSQEVLDENDPNAIATKRLHEAISKFAKGDIEEGDFRQLIASINDELGDAGGKKEPLMADNYMEVAAAARARYEISHSIDDVMDGFAFVNGEARSNVRSEAHRDAIDKLTNALSNSRITSWIPPEIIGTAASVLTNQGKGAIKTALIAGTTALVGATAAPAIVPVAVGALTAGIFAAVKERNRTTTDRETQARRMAQGEEAGDRKYDKQMEAAQYEKRSAADLSKSIEDAIASGDADALSAALAMAETSVMMSDERGIDLVKFSSSNTDVIESERMRLDVARAQAKVKMRELVGEDSSADMIADAVRSTTETLENDISAKDKAFRKLRRRRVAGRGVKSAITAGVFAVGAQEIQAFFRNDTTGYLEHMFHKDGNDLPDAHTTLLGMGIPRTERVNQFEGENLILTDQRIQELRDEGYTVTAGEPQITQSEEQVGFSEWANEQGNATCSNWLGNGTRGSDRNELRGYFSNEVGPYTILDGGKAWGGGQEIDTSQLDGNSFGFFATIMGNKCFVPATEGPNGSFIPDYANMDSTLADIVRSRSFDMIQGGYINDVSADGNIDFSSIFTFGGSGNYPDTVTSIVETTQNTWNVEGFDRLVERVVDSFPVFALSGRTNLTRGRRGDGRVQQPVSNSGGGMVMTPPAPAGEVSSGGESATSGVIRFENRWGSASAVADPSESSTATSSREAVLTSRRSTSFTGEGSAVASPTGAAETSRTAFTAEGSATAVPDHQESAPAGTSVEGRAWDTSRNADGTRTETTYDDFNEVTRFDYTEQDLDALVAYIENDDDRARERANLKETLDYWNGLPDAERIKYMNGYGDLGNQTSSAVIMLNNSYHVIGGRAETEEYLARAYSKLNKESSEPRATGISYEMITADSQDTKIDISDDDLRVILSGVRDPESAMTTVKRSIESWNAEPEERRRGFLEATDPNDANIIGNSGIALENWGLLTSKHFINRRISNVLAAPMPGTGAAGANGGEASGEGMPMAA